MKTTYLIKNDYSVLYTDDMFEDCLKNFNEAIKDHEGLDIYRVDYDDDLEIECMLDGDWCFTNDGEYIDFEDVEKNKKALIQKLDTLYYMN